MCLRRTPSQARESRPILTEEDGVETAVDGSQVSPLAGNGAGGHALAAIEPLEGGGAVLAELAAVEHNLSTPDRAPATARLRPQLGRLRGVLRPLWPRAAPGGPQALALYFKALET